jgi:hypothetical protein
MREWNATPARRAAEPLWAAAPSVTKYGFDRLGRLVWAEYRPADAAGNTVARITGGIGPDGENVPGTEQSRLVFDWDAAARLRRVRQLTPSSGSPAWSAGFQPAPPFSVQRSTLDVQRSVRLSRLPSPVSRL